MTFYYEGIARLDWGFGNPNRTAALIACLMAGVWVLAWRPRWGFWAAWLCFSLLGILLVQTFSRGGMLAAAAGSLVLAIFAPRPWPKARVILIGASIAAFLAAAFSFSASNRVASSWQGDPSVLNRLELWKEVPRMIADSPAGWGLGNSQNVHRQWYQAPERQERFLNLVSLHFTILAEVPWNLRIAYAVGWALIFLLTFPSSRVPELSPAFAVALTFFVAGVFTHFGTSWPVYLPLVLSVGFAIVMRLRRSAWPTPRAVGLGAAASCLVFVPAFLSGSSALNLRGDSKRVVVGKDSPGMWVYVSPAVLGSGYGKIFRESLAGNTPTPAMGFSEQLSNIPPTEKLVIAGTLEPSLLSELRRIQPRRLILLNTNLYPLQVQEFSVPEISAIFGEFADSQTLSAWRQSAKITIIPGQGNFLANWPEVLAENAAKHPGSQISFMPEKGSGTTPQ